MSPKRSRARKVSIITETPEGERKRVRSSRKPSRYRSDDELEEETRDTMRAQHSTGVVNAASQNTSPQDDEEDSPAVQNTSTTRTRHTSSRITQEDTGVDDIVMSDKDSDSPDFLNSDDDEDSDNEEFPQKRTHRGMATFNQSRYILPSEESQGGNSEEDEEWKPSESQGGNSEEDEEWNFEQEEEESNSGPVKQIEKARKFLCMQVSKTSYLKTCTICNCELLVGEWVLKLLYSANFYGFPERLYSALIHLACATQIITLHGKENYISMDHINFVESCVLTFNRKGQIVPLHYEANIFSIVEKALRKNFYQDEDVVSDLTKVHFVDNDAKYRTKRLLPIGDVIFEDANEDSSSCESNEDDNSGENIAEPNEETPVEPETGAKEDENQEDKWDLQHIFTIEEITSTDPLPQVCMTESCQLLACIKYVQRIDQTNIWYSCLDCQKDDFGGWPEELEEYPVKFLTVEHRNTMKDLCTGQSSIAMPNIPINENGDFTPRKIEEIPPKTVVLEVGDKFLEINGWFTEKRNKEEDDIHFCANKSGKCWDCVTPTNEADISDNSKTLYDVKCGSCSNPKHGPRYVCKICNTMYTSNKILHTEEICKKKQGIVPYIRTFYTCNMQCIKTNESIDIREAIKALVNNPKSVLHDILEHYTVFDVGVSHVTEINKCKSHLSNSMGIQCNGGCTKFFESWISDFEHVHGIGIKFANVKTNKNKNSSGIGEKFLYESIVHTYKGIVVCHPASLGLINRDTRRENGNEEFWLYVVAGNPKDSFALKEKLRKGRTVTKKEKKLRKEKQTERNLQTLLLLKESIAELHMKHDSLADLIRSNGNSSEEAEG